MTKAGRSKSSGWKAWLVRVVVAFAMVAPACGASTIPQASSDADAGSDTDNCEVGETRECIGRGACRGGQFCATDGWSGCDCGDDGDGGSGSSSPASGAAGAPATDGGGMVGASTGELGGNAGVAGTSTSEDDPCDGVMRGCQAKACGHAHPDEPYGLTFDEPCSELSACGFANVVARVDEARTYPIFRLPRASELAGDCGCDDGPAIAAKLVLYAIVRGEDRERPPKGHFTVRAPWYVGLPDPEQTCVPEERAQCTEELEAIWTDSLDAPEVNIYYAPGPCPE